MICLFSSAFQFISNCMTLPRLIYHWFSIGIPCIFLVHKPTDTQTLCKTCPFLELFWSVFSCIWTEYGEIRSISPYWVRMREDTDQNNSKYRHFLHSEKCFPYSTSHPKQCLKNIPFVMARKIYTIVDNNSFEKNKQLNELKRNFKIYGYLEKIVEIGMQKALEILQTVLRQSRAINHNNNLRFTFDPSNP